MACGNARIGCGRFGQRGGFIQRDIGIDGGIARFNRGQIFLRQFGGGNLLALQHVAGLF